MDLNKTNETIIPTNNPDDSNTVYFDYDPRYYSILPLYRTQNDIASSLIAHSRAEGLGRYEIGKIIGINTKTKSGNRKVSASIQSLTKAFPQYIGQFQKMEGKMRMIKYYNKDSQPASYTKMTVEFEKLSDKKCPYKIGDVIKFPNTKFTTLRISDVTLKRMLYILQLIKEETVIITSHRLVKYILNREAEEGYPFQIDKKSVSKCLLALQREGCCRMLQGEVVEDNANKTFDVITRYDIKTVTHPDVQEVLAKTINTFHEEGRIFPTGQPRFFRATPEEREQQMMKKINSNLLDAATIANMDFNKLTVKERFMLFRHVCVFAKKAVEDSGKEEAKNEDVLDTTSKTVDDYMNDGGGGGGENLDDSLRSMDDEMENNLTDSLKTDTLSRISDNLNTTSSIAQTLPILPAAAVRSNGYGYQAKMVRCAILHEFVFHLVYLAGKNRNYTPTVYDLFPPTKNNEQRKLEDMVVFDDEPDSPYRFVPALPAFTDVQRGWFLVKDMFGVIPLSIFVLLINIKREINGLKEYLEDPIRRHFLLQDLPDEIRSELITRKYFTLMEQQLLLLCAFGLMKVAPPLDGNRSSTGPASLFLITNKARLYDTSTAEKSYAVISKPMTEFPRYEYVFEDLSDICRFWNHFKAIANSTPLNWRNECGDVKLDHRKFAVGSIDRTPYLWDYSIPLDEIIEPHITCGCAGYDPNLFAHIDRHWDLTSNSSSHFEWFALRWQANATASRQWAAERVTKLDPTWSSYIASFMPTDLELLRKKKLSLPLFSEKTLMSLGNGFKRRLGATRSRNTSSKNSSIKRAKLANTSDVEGMDKDSFADESNFHSMDSPNRSLIDDEVLNEDGEVNSEKLVNAFIAEVRNTGPDEELPSFSGTSGILRNGKGKRQLDEIDIKSRQRSVYMRSRFTARERDMLVLIRAVSFFLNPVHKFWLDPTVMRDIMHQYVPESRCKTVNSLMAAGIRDLIHHNRVSHLQYIVRTLASYKQMSAFRQHTSMINFQRSEEKNNFFKEVFDNAYNILYKENLEFPSVLTNDENFDKYLEQNNLELATMITPASENNELITDVNSQTKNDSNQSSIAIQESSTLPRRSAKPSDISSTKHCVGYNMIMSILLSSSKNKEDFDSIETSSTSTQEDEGTFQMETLLNTINAISLGELLDQLRTDGIVSRHRPHDQVENGILPNATTNMLRNQAKESVYYRHFFNHRYNNEIYQMTKKALEKFKKEKADLTEEDDVGNFLVLLQYLISIDKDIDFTVPNSLDELFLSKDENLKSVNTSKQLRYLENSDLQLSKIIISPNEPIGFLHSIPDFETTLKAFIHKIPIEELSKGRSLNMALDKFESDLEKESAKAVYLLLESSGVSGLSEEEIQISTNLPPLNLKSILEKFVLSYEIFPCGIDTRRYVLTSFAKYWMVINQTCGFFPRPWTFLSGEINYAVLRWMAEAVLVFILSKPGAQIDDLINSFAFAVQPILIEELLSLIENIGCCTILIKTMNSLSKTSPFSKTSIQKTVRYAMPLQNALERFSEFFKKG